MEATGTVLARTLDERDRDRFLDAMPGRLKDRMPGQLKGRLPDEKHVRNDDEGGFRPRRLAAGASTT
ncbi:hypothetical protein E1287_41250 [Actinomadura sp. KC06]|uniref:hypothetical protein n=1 Tax=Actinomadura sp. KC06 TaxID=2530369 RepID=UPI0010D5ECF8|nr:hypothetical protein [Actinomadura sp. KC06]TDD20579.1 hypothetical protein E1287_41250 [Actinomadura sp. KC06]